MPIVVKDYTWTQTPKMVHIRIVLNPGYREKVDMFTTDTYIKAHFSPFLFEVFLLHKIDSENSKCLVKEDLIVLDLVKKDKMEWEQLEKDLTKSEKLKHKQEILEKCQEEAKEKSEQKRIKKTQLDRFTVQQAMDLDNKKHNLMDSRRDEERNKAMNALEEWRVNTEEPRYYVPYSNSGVTMTELASSEDEKEPAKSNEANIPSKFNKESDLTPPPESSKESIDSILKSGKETQPTKPVKQKIPPVRKPVKIPIKSEYVEKKREEMVKRVLPGLRKTAELEITHTPRTFPTPSRESTADEEQTWLKNITMARRATGFLSEDLRPEEQDPQWCKEKGDEFFKNGNFLGAISAYTHGISLSDKLPSLYANRAATHFALGNFNKCINDCSTAIDLMKPICEGNRRSRAKCITRRAAALARMGYLHKAIGEMKAAAKLLPDNETIKKDIYDMERAWEQNPDSD